MTSSGLKLPVSMVIFGLCRLLVLFVLLLSFTFCLVSPLVVFSKALFKRLIWNGRLHRMVVIRRSWAPTLPRWIHQTSRRRRRRDVIFFSILSFLLIFPVSFSKTLFTSDTSLWILLLSNSYYGYTGSFDLSKKAKPNQHKKQSLSSRRMCVLYIWFFFQNRRQ